jgi:hypothetical protein
MQAKKKEKKEAEEAKRAEEEREERVRTEQFAAQRAEEAERLRQAEDARQLQQALEQSAARAEAQVRAMAAAAAPPPAAELKGRQLVAALPGLPSRGGGGGSLASSHMGLGAAMAEEQSESTSEASSMSSEALPLGSQRGDDGRWVPVGGREKRPDVSLSMAPPTTKPVARRNGEHGGIRGGGGGATAASSADAVSDMGTWDRAGVSWSSGSAHHSQGREPSTSVSTHAGTSADAAEALQRLEAVRAEHTQHVMELQVALKQAERMIAARDAEIARLKQQLVAAHAEAMTPRGLPLDASGEVGTAWRALSKQPSAGPSSFGPATSSNHSNHSDHSDPATPSQTSQAAALSVTNAAVVGGTKAEVRGPLQMSRPTNGATVVRGSVGLGASARSVPLAPTPSKHCGANGHAPRHVAPAPPLSPHKHLHAPVAVRGTTKSAAACAAIAPPPSAPKGPPPSPASKSLPKRQAGSFMNPCLQRSSAWAGGAPAGPGGIVSVPQPPPPASPHQQPGGAFALPLQPSTPFHSSAQDGQARSVHVAANGMHDMEPSPRVLSDTPMSATVRHARLIRCGCTGAELARFNRMQNLLAMLCMAEVC